MDHGHAIVAMNSKDEVVAITSYYIGTTAKHFENKHIAILHNSYILPSYRTSRIFLRGLKLNVEEIVKASPKVEKMLIYAPVSNRYLNSLYSKIARRSDPPHDASPEYYQYVISIETLSRYGTDSQHKR
ncbi:hypothetical protein [Paenibacillus koleovorans]|uniref:hypothetical protein n=1 Tax=Paenibacillus koleovorans TaxID=121608 RepID=UPI000FDC205C|nr:hypothetical protein [Paenibacillus koleovorans]